ncbi:glycosyltransferase [Methylobacterium brachythecii]|uniref:Glycosyl transferase n=1 Tax=Methylobacterium brachythecii TaxID=1176177 RepID=A0A7W6F7F4_9HYPH|nr:glycosyltransferase [Methylobacterium brachythecii]MBB3903318.1 vancomycin aglycone glucosyltransferase [Methylobacterium brachythecii]GLS46831.1 glycosyl transferase [Methylobacterium brachythecii]
MRVLLSTYGSRGDVEPIAGLAAALQELGADLRVCAPPDDEFVDVLARAGVAPVPGFAPLRDWVTKLKKQPATDPARRAAEIIETAKRIVSTQFDVMAAAAEGCDAILATGLFPSVAAAQAVAEQRGLRFACAAFCPRFLPSEHHRPYEYPTRPHPPGVSDNRVLWQHDLQTQAALFGEGINTLRGRIGLAPLENLRDPIITRRPWLAADPILAPWQPTDLRDVVQTGAWILSDERPLPAELIAFLEAGTPPVYVGFGSMPMQALKEASRLAVEACRARGRRVVLAHGWAELDLIADRADGLAVGDINQQALFRRVAAVLHHGGAGTTTAAARAGVPQVIVPQVADQPYWGSRVAQLGIGASDGASVPSFDGLSDSLAKALAPETRARAAALAGTIRVDGAATAARLLLAPASV